MKERLQKIQLWVLEENLRARSFYEKVGFKYDNTFQIINMGKELKELRYVTTFLGKNRTLLGRYTNKENVK